MAENDIHKRNYAEDYREMQELHRELSEKLSAERQNLTAFERENIEKQVNALQEMMKMYDKTLNL